MLEKIARARARERRREGAGAFLLPAAGGPPGPAAILRGERLGVLAAAILAAKVRRILSRI